MIASKCLVIFYHRFGSHSCSYQDHSKTTKLTATACVTCQRAGREPTAESGRPSGAARLHCRANSYPQQVPPTAPPLQPRHRLQGREGIVHTGVPGHPDIPTDGPSAPLPPEAQLPTTWRTVLHGLVWDIAPLDGGWRRDAMVEVGQFGPGGCDALAM